MSSTDHGGVPVNASRKSFPPERAGQVGPVRQFRTSRAMEFTSRTPAADWEIAGSVIPMEPTVHSVGRIVVPKQLRDSRGMFPGTIADATAYGAGLQVLPSGRTARIVDVDGGTAAESETRVTDDVIFELIDSLR